MSVRANLFTHTLTAICDKNTLKKPTGLIGSLYMAYAKNLFGNDGDNSPASIRIETSPDVVLIRHRCSYCGTSYIIPVLKCDIPVIAERGYIYNTKTYRQLKEEETALFKQDSMAKGLNAFFNDLESKLQFRLCLECLNRSDVHRYDVKYRPTSLDSVIIRPKGSLIGSGKWGVIKPDFSESGRVKYQFFDECLYLNSNKYGTITDIGDTDGNLIVKDDFDQDSGTKKTCAFTLYRCKIDDKTSLDLLERDFVPFIPFQTNRISINDDGGSINIWERVIYTGTRADGYDWESCHELLCSVKYSEGTKENTLKCLASIYKIKDKSYIPTDTCLNLDAIALNEAFTKKWSKNSYLRPYMLGKDGVQWSYCEPMLLPKPGDMIQITETAGFWTRFENNLTNVYFQGGTPDYRKPFIVKDVYSTGYIKRPISSTFVAFTGVKPIRDMPPSRNKSASNMPDIQMKNINSERVIMPYCTFTYTCENGNVSNGVALLDAIKQITPGIYAKCEIKVAEDGLYEINNDFIHMKFSTKEDAEKMYQIICNSSKSINKRSLMIDYN